MKYSKQDTRFRIKDSSYLAQHHYVRNWSVFMNLIVNEEKFIVPLKHFDVMAQLVERLPHNRKVDGSSHGRVIPKTLKMVLVAFLLWRSKNEKGVGNLNTRSYQWTSPPL